MDLHFGRAIKFQLLLLYNNRVPVPPGKSLIFSKKFPVPGKSWKMSSVLKVKV